MAPGPQRSTRSRISTASPPPADSCRGVGPGLLRPTVGSRRSSARGRPRQGHLVHRSGHRDRRFRSAAGRRRGAGAADRRALGHHRAPAPLAAHRGCGAERAGRRPAGGHLGTGPRLLRSSARRRFRPRRRRPDRVRPVPRDWSADEVQAARAARGLRGRRARARGGPDGGRDVAGAARRRHGGQLDRHLGGRPRPRGHRLGPALRGHLRARGRPHHRDGPAVRRARPPRRPGLRPGGHAGRGGGPRPVHRRAAHAARRQWRMALDRVTGAGARRRRRRAGAHPRDGPGRHRGPP